MSEAAPALSWGAASDVGRLREVNQDRLFCQDDVFVVADGMGGHQAGEVAAELAVAEFATAAVHSIDEFTDRIQRANRSIIDAAREDTTKFGMGTTLTALARFDDAATSDGPTLVVANVGDSRTYLFQDGEIGQVTDDHSLVGDLMRQGQISEEEAANHPRRNIVTRALGIDSSLEIDTFLFPMVPGERFVLCSDGLSDEINPDAIASVLRRLGDPQDAADELVRLANEHGGRDNVTVVVVDVVTDAGAVQERRPTAVTEPAAEPEPEGPPRRRWITARVVGFAVLVLAVFGVASWALTAAARGTYYVGVDGSDVVIYQGRPGGLLWFDPTIEEATGLRIADIPPARVAPLEAGVDQGSLAEARTFVANLKTEIADIEAATATIPSSTSPPSPTSSVPVGPTVTTVVISTTAPPS